MKAFLCVRAVCKPRWLWNMGIKSDSPHTFVSLEEDDSVPDITYDTMKYQKKSSLTALTAYLEGKSKQISLHHKIRKQD